MKYPIVVLLLILSINTGYGHTAERETVVLDGDIATVVFDLAGGSITDFHLKDRPVNPLTWNTPPKDDTSPYGSGHFICFDRLGNPSQSERENGMPFHGEAAHVYWRLIDGPDATDTSVTATVQCSLPIGGMTLTRHLELSRHSAVLSVTDTVKNDNPLGRFYNLVQHPSLAPPFLNKNIRVDTNAWKGFAAGNPMPNPEEPVIYWPCFVHGGALIDLRFPAVSSQPAVTSFRQPAGCETGWITASNNTMGLMLGYVWNTQHYPWVRVWREVTDGIPKSLGIEFGTTPLPLPFGHILRRGNIFGTRTIEYLDAGEKKVFGFSMFLTKIPNKWGGVSSVVENADMLLVGEASDQKLLPIPILKK